VIIETNFNIKTMNFYFISGTSRGIGKALAEKLLSKGDFVYGFSRSQSIQHKNYKHFSLDFAQIDDIYAYQFPKLENPEQIVLVNNAGVLGQVSPLGKIEDSQIEKVMKINAIVPGILMNKFLSAYEQLASKKLIINISSGAGRHTIESWASYCASKSAMDMMSKVAAEEQTKYFEHPTRIFSVAPGIVDTKMQDEIRKVSEEAFKDVERFKNYKQTNALSSPESVADKILKLIASPDDFSEVLLDVRSF